MLNTTNNLGTRGFSERSKLIVGVVVAIAAIALLTADAIAQDLNERFELVGTVVDAENGSALAGAWVSLTDSEWGSIADSEGRFRIPDLSEGPVALSVEQLGYETLSWQGEVSDATEPIVLEVTPRPLVLEGLSVVSDRFRSRRNAVTTTAFAYGTQELATASQRTALDFIALRGGSWPVDCAGVRGNVCLIVRGRTIHPTVFIDEAPVLGGLEYLNALAPHEFYMIEIYGSGRHIRAYTPGFMERAAKRRLQPIALLF